MKPPERERPQAKVAGQQPQRPAGTPQRFKPPVAQTKSAAPANAARHPVAPPVYKPNPSPRVAQAKKSAQPKATVSGARVLQRSASSTPPPAAAAASAGVTIESGPPPAQVTSDVKSLAPGQEKKIGVAKVPKSGGGGYEDVPLYALGSAAKHAGADDEELRKTLQMALYAKAKIVQADGGIKVKINGGKGYLVYKQEGDKVTIFHYHWNYNLDD